MIWTKTRSDAGVAAGVATGADAGRDSDIGRGAFRKARQRSPMFARLILARILISLPA